MGVQHIVDVAVQLRWRALIARLELGAEIGPFFTSKRHQAAAEGLLRALIALQAGDKIVVASAAAGFTIVCAAAVWEC